MAAIVTVSRSTSQNRRGRVRQKIHVPAYASINAASGGMLDLYEILDISEIGFALQCSLPIELDQTVELFLDLAETGARIAAKARVAWFDRAGRVGLSLPALTGSDSRQLQEWLFLNAVTAAANASPSDSASRMQNAAPRQNYSDLLTAATAVQREAESLGPDVEGVLSLIASRSRSLLGASGAAIALDPTDSLSDETPAGTKTRSMVCRASAGPGAPPVGMNLPVGTGFSGECVRTGTVLHCDDTEIDERVDRQSCRAIGIRAMLAAPVRVNEHVIGLLEIFSAYPRSFNDNDGALLQRFAETIAAAFGRAGPTDGPSLLPPNPTKTYGSPGSILFANAPEEEIVQSDLTSDKESVGGIRLPRGHLYLLLVTAATVSLALGYLSKPWIQKTLQVRERNGEHTVLASSKPPADAVDSAANSATPNLSIDAANLSQLQELARKGNAGAENALGLFYSAGDEKQGIKRNETEAARWFAKAAEQGNVSAQSKLGSLFWSGRGVPKDDTRAYFWTVLARANGDEAGKTLAPFIANRLTTAQRSVIEQQADEWLQHHESVLN
jgi:GAF domain-containing protein